MEAVHLTVVVAIADRSHRRHGPESIARCANAQDVHWADSSGRRNTSIEEVSGGDDAGALVVSVGQVVAITSARNRRSLASEASSWARYTSLSSANATHTGSVPYPPFSSATSRSREPRSPAAITERATSAGGDRGRHRDRGTHGRHQRRQWHVRIHRPLRAQPAGEQLIEVVTIQDPDHPVVLDEHATQRLIAAKQGIDLDAQLLRTNGDSSKQLEVNVTASFAMARAVGRHLRTNGGGAIVNVASNCGTVGYNNIEAQLAELAVHRRPRRLHHAPRHARRLLIGGRLRLAAEGRVVVLADQRIAAELHRPQFSGCATRSTDPSSPDSTNTR